MLSSALEKGRTPSSYFSGFQITTASAVRLRLSLIVRFLHDSNLIYRHLLTFFVLFSSQIYIEYISSLTIRLDCS